VTSLIAWNEAGDILATLDGVWDGKDAIDLAVAELSGRKLRTYWDVPGAVASGTWPEHLGSRSAEYRVERAADGTIVALVHRQTGERRERSAVQPSGGSGVITTD